MSSVSRHRLRRIAACAVLAASCGFTCLGGTFDLNLGEDAARASLTLPLDADRMDLDLGFLHSNDTDLNVAHGGVYVAGRLSGSPGLHGGVGTRLYLLDQSSNSGGALSIGGFLRYAIPAAPRVRIEGHAYFAPNVVSFSDLEEYNEYSVRASYQLLDSADVYIGLRRVRVQFDTLPSFTADRSGHIGIRLRFGRR